MRRSVRAPEVTRDEHPATRTPARALPSAAALSDRERTDHAPGAGGETGSLLPRLPRRTARRRGRGENPQASSDAHRDGALPVPKDLGKLRLQVPALDRSNLFFQLISRRYERGSILITSNQSLGAWGEVFGDAVIASAILDRLLHHSITINIKGESFRLKEKLKAGLLKPKLEMPEAS